MGDGLEYELTHVRLSDGWETTVYLVRHPLATTSVNVVWFPESERLDHWCTAHEHSEAIVAGFFLRDPYRPLGEVRVDGAVVEHEPISPPWGPKRGCVHIAGGVGIRRREELADDPPGDLVQAGPLLVSDGRSLVDGEDREGSSAGAEQFDSDITVGRHPRCALGLGDGELGCVLRRAPLGGRSRTDACGAGAAADLVRLARGDQPRRRRLGDARASQAPPEPPLLASGSAGPRIPPGGDRPSPRTEEPIDDP